MGRRRIQTRRERKLVGEFLYGMLHGFFDVDVGGELVVDVDEEDVEALVGGDDGMEEVFVEAVGFTDEAFDPVALDGPLEAAFGDADGKAGGRVLGGTGEEAEDDAKGKGDEAAASGEECPEGVAAVDSFFARKSVCGLCVHSGDKVIKKTRRGECPRGACRGEQMENLCYFDLFSLL